MLIDNVPVLCPRDLLDAVLPAEPCDSSDGQSAEPSEDEPSWWICRTLSRQEKEVARRLHRFQAPFYLPLIKSTTIQRGQKRTSWVPLFPGYLFVFGAREDRLRALQTKRTAEVTRVVESAKLQKDLNQVHRLIIGQAPLEPCQRVGPGQRVRIKTGNFEGIEGVVVKRRKKSELLVIVDYIQQGVSLAVEDWMLEPV